MFKSLASVAVLLFASQTAEAVSIKQCGGAAASTTPRALDSSASGEVTALHGVTGEISEAARHAGEAMEPALAVALGSDITRKADGTVVPASPA